MSISSMSFIISLLSGSIMKHQSAGIQQTRGAIRPRDLVCCLNVLVIEPQTFRFGVICETLYSCNKSIYSLRHPLHAEIATSKRFQDFSAYVPSLWVCPCMSSASCANLICYICWFLLLRNIRRYIKCHKLYSSQLTKQTGLASLKMQARAKVRAKYALLSLV